MPIKIGRLLFSFELPGERPMTGISGQQKTSMKEALRLPFLPAWAACLQGAPLRKNQKVAVRLFTCEPQLLTVSAVFSY
jgi:hypothetical protein